jgi:hypothetical protein
LHGGLYTDDWPIASIYSFHGTGDLIRRLFLGDHSRPLAAVYLGIAQTVTGADGHGHAAIGLALHVLAVWSLFWLLRTLSLRWWEAAGIAILLLLFPFADSTWLWFAITQSSLSLLLAALGLVAFVYAFRGSGSRKRALHGLALILLAGSVLTYEAAAAVLAIGVVAISLRERPTRTAILQSMPALAVIGLAVIVPRIRGVLPGIEPHQGITLSEQLRHAWKMATQSASVMTTASMPFGSAHRNVVIPVLAAILIVALLAWARTRREDDVRRGLQRSLCWAGIGIGILVLSYVVYVNTNPGFYEPAAPGSDNRINTVAAVGYCVIVYAIASLIGLLVGRGRPPLVTAAVASVLTVAVALGYAERDRRDVRAWDLAAAIDRSELTKLARSLPPPAHYTTIYTFGQIGETAPRVYAFRVTWDLNAAVKLLWRDSTVNAYPIFAGTTMTCGPASVYPNGFANGNGPKQAAPYGHILFFDFRDYRRLPVRNLSDCKRAAAEFMPGALT